MANLYFGELGRLAEVAPKPGQCCTPATQLELLTLGPAQLCGAEQATPGTKGPLWAICSTPENFYLPLPTHSSQCLLNLTSHSEIQAWSLVGWELALQMSIEQRVDFIINGSQQRGLSCVKYWHTLDCKLCNVPPPSLSEMFSRWLMQVSSAGKKINRGHECSKGQKRCRRCIWCKALQIQLSSDKLWQHTCQYNSLRSSPKD